MPRSPLGKDRKNGDRVSFWSTTPPPINCRDLNYRHTNYACHICHKRRPIRLPVQYLCSTSAYRKLHRIKRLTFQSLKTKEVEEMYIAMQVSAGNWLVRVGF